MKTVFITGISGLLGTNLAHSFLEQGYKVTGLVRNKNSYKGNSHPALELVEGSLFGDLSETLRQADIVVHAAAETRQCLSGYEHYYSINRNATVLLYYASVNCNVKHFIYISTANTSGYGTEQEPGAEDTPVKCPFDKSLYAKSKLAAEDFLMGTANKMKVTILNPTFMLGAYDSKPSSGKIILMGWNKRIVAYPPGGKNFVYVKDVAQAALLCIEKGGDREKYLITGENLSYRYFLQSYQV